MPGIPCFQILSTGQLRAISIERPFSQFQRAVAIMQHGLRFECGSTDYGVELMIVDRYTDRGFPVPLDVETVGNTPGAVRAGMDRLIDRFFARIGGRLAPEARDIAATH